MAERELTDLLRQLVAIPSVNPLHNPDPAVSGEGRLASFATTYLEKKGFKVIRQERDDGRPNIVATYGPDAASHTLMFESHLDTVGVSGMTWPPFDGAISDGRMYGRGTCDTKGPMAAALHALSPELLRSLADRGIRVVFAGAMGEETGNIGAVRLVEDGIKADQTIVLEPTDLAIIHAHKGALWFEIEVRGIAGHGSDPDRGLSAILAMTKVITFLRTMSTTDRKHAKHPFLGGPSLNIGSIHGGQAVNVVPDRCVIQVDRRTLPGENREEILERVRAFLVQLENNRQIVSHDIRLLKEGTPFQTSTESTLVDTLKQGCRACGIEPRTEGASWYSDAGPLSQACREIVVFGPGSIHQAHTGDEFIDLNSLQAGCDIVRKFLELLGKPER